MITLLALIKRPLAKLSVNERGWLVENVDTHRAAVTTIEYKIQNTKYKIQNTKYKIKRQV